jgi:hypothetical protein
VNQTELGPFVLEAASEPKPVEGTTPAGYDVEGTAAFHHLRGPADLFLTIRDTRWSNGERDLVACARHASPERFDTLVERLHLAVLRSPDFYVDLRQARIRTNGRAGLFNASLEELNAGADLDVHAILRKAGATHMGTRGAVLGDCGRTRARYTARFDDHSCAVPLVAYVLTRVAPVARGAAA